MVGRRVINVTGGVLAEEIVQEFGRSLRGKLIRLVDEEAKQSCLQGADFLQERCFRPAPRLL